MRTPHPGQLAAAIGITLVVVAGVALATSAHAPIFTANEPGRPVPQITSSRQETLTTTVAPTLANRPGSLPLDGVDPCTVLTAAQRAALSLDAKPTPYTDPEFDRAKACTIRGITSGTVARLALVLDMSVDVWLSREAQVQTQPVTVDGWPALVVRTPGLDDACAVEVDTSDNEFLDVLFRDGGNTPPIPQDTLCLGAQRVAESAVTSLRARR